MAPGLAAFQVRSWSAVIESASEQPARMSGIRTCLPGERIAAVSAMNFTPHRAMTAASVAAPARASASESPTKSATSWISGRW